MSVRVARQPIEACLLNPAHVADWTSQRSWTAVKEANAQRSSLLPHLACEHSELGRIQGHASEFQRQLWPISLVLLDSQPRRIWLVSERQHTIDADPKSTSLQALSYVPDYGGGPLLLYGTVVTTVGPCGITPNPAEPSGGEGPINPPTEPPPWYPFGGGGGPIQA